MTVLKVLLIVIAVLWLISRIRLGGWVQYSGEGLAAKVLIGPFRLTLLPRKEKPQKKSEKEKSEKKRKKKKKPEKEKAEKPKRKLPPVPELLRLAAETAGRLKRKIRIDDVTLHLTWAAKDPMDAALGFGRANAAMGMIWPLIENNFRVKKQDVGVSVEFDRDAPELFCKMALTMTVGQLLALGVGFVVRLLIIWSRSGRDSAKKQEAKL